MGYAEAHDCDDTNAAVHPNAHGKGARQDGPGVDGERLPELVVAARRRIAEVRPVKQVV